MTATSLEIRSMTEGDLPTAAAETLREGWAADRREIALSLDHDPAGAVVAEVDGRWAGMACATAYVSNGWVGNLIVRPERRRQGVATALLRHSLERLDGAGVREVRLDADPPGEALYRNMGFAAERLSFRYHLGTGVPAARYVPPAGISLEPLTADELPSVAGLDREAFGDDRGALLGHLVDRAVWARVAVRRGRVSGFAMVRAGERAAFVGPAVADDPEVGRALLAAAAAEAASRRRPVVMGVLEGSAVALDWVAAAGWSEREGSLRMVRGGGSCPGRPELVLAITNGALG